MRLTIHDLERESGLSRRTIHYYAHEGLLPAARGSGPGATYDEEHLLRLRLISALKTAGLRLDRIGCALDALDTAQMRRLLEALPEAELEDPRRLAEWLHGAGDHGPAAEPGTAAGPAARLLAVDGCTHWVRHEVVPGLELHYCADRAGDLETKVRRLSALARRLFAEAAE